MGLRQMGGRWEENVVELDVREGEVLEMEEERGESG